MKIKQQKLPNSHIPYTDKNFLRANEILKKEAINPNISIKIFCKGEGPVAGIDEAIAAIKKYSDINESNGEIWVINKDYFSNEEPLMIIKGPAQSIIELETMYLGILSYAISLEMEIKPPNSKETIHKLKRLKDIYMDIPIIYFGARHYHWSLDKAMAGAALKGGAAQTTTDIGSSNIGQKGVGTTPHILTIILASIYGRRNATLKTAELFDKHMPLEIPRIILVDTFNREISDSLAVAKYFGIRKNIIRLDTSGENIGEGGSLYKNKKTQDPEYKTGTGVTIELVTNVRNALIKNGFRDNTDIFLSSGFGNEDKARAFVRANNEYREEKGVNLFSGVGIGELSNSFFCIADVFEVNGESFAKTGREWRYVNFTNMKRVL